MFYNPRCSKCRTAQGLLTERGIEARIIDYLVEPPAMEDLRRLMTQLGIEDPRDMMRPGEDIYGELALAGEEGDALLEAIVAHPILLERPIVVRGDRAVIARPPELLLDLL